MRKLLFIASFAVISFQVFSQTELSPSIVQEPKIENLPPGKEGEEIRYGFELLSNTPKYLGPKGSVARNTRTLMSCRNCHMDMGRRPFGNSWLDTHAIYPQYRAREGIIITLPERINNCFSHPMNGKLLAENSREMKAILLYYKWLAAGRPVLLKDQDSRLVPPLPFMSRAADPKKGEVVYKNNCVMCHGSNGQGELQPDKKSYLIPPVWGKESYQLGSSLSRVSVLARFVKANMPYGTTHDKPVLTDEESWDVAAYINSQPRPKWSGKVPYPHSYEKPYDYPMGPYADAFPAEQHKYGPYQPIVNYWQADIREGDITKTSPEFIHKYMAETRIK